MWAAMVALLGMASSCQAPPAGPTEASDLTVYLSREEALRVALPHALRVVEERVILSAQERREVESILGHRVLEPSFTVHAGLKPGGGLEGYAVIHEEVGKFKPFQFVVAVEPDGSVRRVAMLVYRESRGGEIAHRRFSSQYEGKRVTDPLRLQQDILNVSGATMSCTSMTIGVKKVLAVLEVVYRRNPERLGRLLGSNSASLPARGAPSALLTNRGAVLEARAARYLMGAICELRLFGSDRAQLLAAAECAFHAMEEAEARLSDYRASSEISLLSRHAGRGEVAISPLTADFLEASLHLARETGGACDVTVAPLVRAWGGRGVVSGAPGPEERARLRGLIGFEGLHVKRAAGGEATAFLDRPGMAIDPGAVGKGFAVDLAVKALRGAGVTSALVDFSGNLYALGAPPGRSTWPVGVRDPESPENLLGVVELRDTAIASSGGYERFSRVAGKTLCHILSPRDLAPVEGVLGTTVIAPTATLADGYSTAAFVLGEKAVALLEGRPGVQGVVLLGSPGSSTRRATRGWRMIQ